MFEMRTNPDKGRGLFASTNIPRGTRIMEEAPLLAIKEHLFPIAEEMEEHLASKLSTLDPKQRALFHNLHNAFPELPHWRWQTFQCNCFPCGTGDIAVLATRCLINHSCNPNAFHSWNANLEMLTIHAIRDIPPGEEIAITYGVGDTSTRAERREYLVRGYGFECACQLCAAPEAEVAASDTRRGEIAALFQRNCDDERHELRPDEVLGDCAELRRLRALEYGREDNPFAGAVWYDAFQVAAIHGRWADAVSFAALAYGAWVVLEGKDRPDSQVLQKYMENPKAFHRYGLCARRWPPEAANP